MLYKQQLGPHHWDDLFNVPEPLAYVFCDALPAEERTPVSILSILLAQMARQNSELLDAMATRMEESKTTSASMEELKIIFEKDVPSTIYRYYLVVDGFERIVGSMSFLLSLSTSNRNIPKIITFSRPEPNLVKELLGYPKIEVSRTQVAADIKLVSPAQINALEVALGAHDNQSRRIVAELFFNSPNGSFLWHRVISKYLGQQSADPNLVATLYRFPNDTSKVYAAAFERVTQELDGFARDLAVRALKLIAIAQRPLDILELQTALSITEDGTKFKYDPRLQNLENILRSTCDPLLDIRHSGVHGGIQSVFFTTVTLIHPTLEDFLFSSSSTSKPYGLPLDRSLLHAEAARLCLTYLSLSEFGTPNHTPSFRRGRSSSPLFPPNGPFADFFCYATLFLFHHVFYSGEIGAKDIHLLESLHRFASSPLQVQTWVNFIKTNNQPAILIWKQKMENLRCDWDTLYPGMGDRINQWLNNIEISDFGDTMKSWLDQILREILGGSMET